MAAISHRTETRSRRSYAKLAFAAILLAAAASIASNQRAASQQNPTVAPKPAGTEVAPRGQREVTDVTYGDIAAVHKGAPAQTFEQDIDE
jgi:hypothetical protein